MGFLKSLNRPHDLLPPPPREVQRKLLVEALTPIQPIPVKETIKMNFFQKFGHDFVDWFKKGEKVAEAAQPFVNLLAPDVAPAFNAVVAANMQIETLAAAVTTDTTMTNGEKLLTVVAMSAPTVTKELNALGVNATPDVVNKFTTATVQALQALESK